MGSTKLLVVTSASASSEKQHPCPSGHDRRIHQCDHQEYPSPDSGIAMIVSLFRLLGSHHPSAREASHHPDGTAVQGRKRMIADDEISRRHRDLVAICHLFNNCPSYHQAWNGILQVFRGLSFGSWAISLGLGCLMVSSLPPHERSFS
jgi:hypothetical protein